MVYQRLLQAESGPGVDGSAEWVFSEAGLEECVALVYDSIPASMRNAPSHLAGEGAKMTLARATQVLSQIGLSAAGVLRLLLDGRLEAHTSEDQKTSGGLRSLLFTETGVNAYLDSVLSASTWLGYLEVAARMNIVRKHGIVKEWARRGLLHAVSARRGVYLFDPLEVERFVAAHILARDAAELCGVGINTIQAWVRAGRLLPVSGPGVDQADVFLFRRVDVEGIMESQPDRDTGEGNVQGWQHER
jgi:hypothetical protein